MKYLAMTLLLCALGCRFPDEDVSNVSADDSFNTQGISYVNKGTLTIGSNTISGSGSFVFTKKIAEDEVNAKKNYHLTFTLEDDATLEFTVHSDELLSSGLEILFSRNGISLGANVRASGENVDVSSFFRQVDATQSIDLYIDIHNGESPARIVVWNGDDDFSETAAIFDSATSGLTMPGKGTSVYWGMTLNPSSLTIATLSEAKL